MHSGQPSLSGRERCHVEQQAGALWPKLGAPQESTTAPIKALRSSGTR